MNDGSDFDEGFLTRIYDAVSSRSIRTRHVRPDAAMKGMRDDGGVSGILERKTTRRWIPGFYVLNDHCLYHFDNDRCETPTSFIPLERLFLIAKSESSFVLRSREENSHVVMAKLSDSGTVKFKSLPEVQFRTHELGKWCKSL
jgi:hypothetical protein